MENAAYELYTALTARHDVTLVSYGGSNKMLPIVYPWLFIKAFVKGVQKNPHIIYMQDGLMAPMGWLLKLILGRPTVLTVHGKEATYGNPLYKLLVPSFIRKQSKVVAVSNETKQQVQAALPGTNPVVVFNGIRDAFYQPEHPEMQYAAIASAAGLSLEELRRYRLVHTGGRLVRRKGVLWFIDEVLPKLVAEQPVLYLISGSGKDREVIEAAINDRGLQENVRLLGRVSARQLQSLYNMSDIFLMPNIPVANDMEGFGLVALEAASCGTMVVASQLEGIQDAIIDGKNGRLVSPLDADGYVRVISEELRHRSISRDAVRKYTLDNYSWDRTAREYEALMEQILTTKK
jgi:phosphatidylinositol alpha-1,6-mannosyltransferase